VNHQNSMLDDMELDVASGGGTISMDGVTGLDSTPSGTAVSRVKTSDKQAKAVLAFIKG
jgi:hypothetical protein